MKKTVLVTGASRGIGRAIAEKFLEEGYIVYGTYVSSKEKIIKLQKTYGEDKFIVCGPYDFTKIEDTNRLVNDLVDVKFDSIVCNAGMFSENDDFQNFDLDDFNKTMNCNFYAPMIICIKMQSRIKNFGSIVIMSSNDAYSGGFASLSYSVSKAALLSLNKCLCVNFGIRGIRVNSVAPGAINTDMNTPEQEFDAPEYTPIGRIGQPSEVAEVVYFLASDKSSFINGENITIDGGYSDVSILLKKEVSRIREFKGYDEVYDMHKELNKGDVLLHLDCCLPHAWNDSEEEKEWLSQYSAAQKRGAIINTILMVSTDDEQKIKNSKGLKNYIENKEGHTKMYVVKKDDIKTLCPDEYVNIGDGYGVINKEKAFIDSYNDANCIGYMVYGETMVEQLENDFNNILQKIENGIIAQIDIYN